MSDYAVLRGAYLPVWHIGRVEALTLHRPGGDYRMVDRLCSDPPNPMPWVVHRIPLASSGELEDAARSREMCRTCARAWREASRPRPWAPAQPAMGTAPYDERDDEAGDESGTRPLF